MQILIQMALYDLKIIFIFVVIGFLVFKIYKKIKGPAFHFNPKTLFIISFLTLIYFPFIQEKTNIIHYLPIEENRRKTSLPPGNVITELLDQKSNYASTYEKFFNDNYGFRDLFVRLKNQIDYSCFSVSDEVIIGKNNWLFYKSVVEKEEIYIEQLPDSQIQKIQNKILTFNRQLKDGGITLLLIPAPMKNSLYPELYTNRTINLPQPTKFDNFLSFLESHPEIKFINVSQILLNHKKEYQVYYQTDFHWNDTGAFFISHATINSLGQSSNTKVKWQYPLVTQTAPHFSGGQNNSLAIFFPPRETAYYVAPPQRLKSQSLDPQKPFIYHFLSQEKNTPLLPKTIFVGNSFLLNFLQTGLFDYFSDILVLHSNDMEKFWDVLPKDTKIVIWQLIEVDLLKNFLFN